MLTSFVSPILVSLVSVCILRNRVFELSICGSQGPTWDIVHFSCAALLYVQNPLY